jgi:phosphoglucosamine mutase
VISASHNPYYDNGIKFFSSEGAKLGDDIEHAIEAELDKPMQVMESAMLGKARRIDDAAGRYIEFCKSTFPNDMDLRGLKIVLDCAHGATYHVAPNVFHELGAEIIAIGNKPDGLNINELVGSTHPQALQKAVLEHQADLGIAFDGDGDRVMMVDAHGNLLDGDQLLYIIALGLHAKGELKGGVAGTLMTNLALEHALQNNNIPFARAKVGDRYVLELLNEKKWLLGGENSGHILTLDKHSSGDAIIAALQVLHALILSGKTLVDLRADLVLYPQVLINVVTAKKVDLDRHDQIQAAVKTAEKELAGRGRVLLRASGTEPKIRVMVEGEDGVLVQKLAEDITIAVKIATGT